MKGNRALETILPSILLSVPRRRPRSRTTARARPCPVSVACFSGPRIQQRPRVWYRDNLGIDLTPTSYDTAPRMQETGPTVFAHFSASTDYFGDPANMWIVNFRVRDLDAMIAQLRATGSEVTVDPESCTDGRFARVYDPEGNPIELRESATPGE